MSDENRTLSVDAPEPTGETRRQLLKGAAGVGIAAATLPALTDTAAAHFPLQLDIDIQPNNAENFIDLEDHEVVSVAVHPTEFLNGDGERESFDPTEEEVRYRFGSQSAVQQGGGAVPIGDGEQTDSGAGDREQILVLDFPVDETGFDGGEETGWLYWERDESGNHGLRGVDATKIYPGANTITLERLVRWLQTMART